MRYHIIEISLHLDWCSRFRNRLASALHRLGLQRMPNGTFVGWGDPNAISERLAKMRKEIGVRRSIKRISIEILEKAPAGVHGELAQPLVQPLVAPKPK
jgi:hypothetical protein